MSTGESTAEFAQIHYTPSPEVLQEAGDLPVWVCPYCGTTGTSAREVRTHITEGEGVHVGISGTSPTRDIVAFDGDGRVVDVIEDQYADRTDSLSRARGHKKREVLNLWFVGFPDVTVSDAVEITDASENYVRTLFERLEDDDLEASEMQALLDAQLQERLGAELELLNSGEYPSAEFVEVGNRVVPPQPSRPDSEASASAPETSHSDAETHQPMSTNSRGAVEATFDDYTGKQVLYNLFALVPDIHYTDAAEIADVSKEHARRNIKSLGEGDVSVAALDDELDVEVQKLLYDRLEERGFTDGDYRPSIKTEATQIAGFEGWAGDDQLEPPSFGLQKQAVIANAVEIEPALDHRDIALVADCSAEYARSVVQRIETQDISPRQVQDMLDEDVQSRIRAFVEEAGLVESATAKPSDDRHASAGAPSPSDAPDSGTREGNDATAANEGSVTFETVDVSAPGAKLPVHAARDRVLDESLKRVRVINAWLAPGERSYADAGRMAGSSTEHARRTYRAIENGDITAEEIRAAYDPSLVNALLTLDAAHRRGQIALGEQDLAEVGADLPSDAVPSGTVTYVRTDELESRLATAESTTEPDVESTTEPNVGETTAPTGARSTTLEEHDSGVADADGWAGAGPDQYLAQTPVRGQPETVVPATKVREVLDMIETLKEFSAADPHENEQRDWVLERISGELEVLLSEATMDAESLTEE